MEDISRRTALKAAAWSAPVVAVALAAPAASASPLYSIYQPYAGWNTEGQFGMEAYVRFNGEPSAGQTVTFTLTPGDNLIFATTSYGDQGYANVTPAPGAVPSTVTTVTISVQDATLTIPVTGTPPT